MECHATPCQAIFSNLLKKDSTPILADEATALIRSLVSDLDDTLPTAIHSQQQHTDAQLFTAPLCAEVAFEACRCVLQPWWSLQFLGYPTGLSRAASSQSARRSGAIRVKGRRRLHVAWRSYR